MAVACAGDLNVLVVLSLGPAEGGQHCRDKEEADPIESQSSFERLGHSTHRILSDTGHFSQARNLPNAMEEHFQVTRLKSRNPIPGASSGDG